MRRIYDISIPITDGGVIYPGSPEIHFEPASSIARGDASNVTALAFGTHTATHVDAALHFVGGGQPVDELPLERLIGPAVVLDFPGDVTAIGEAELRARATQLDGHTRVLLKTRNSALLRRRAEFTRDYAHLSPDGAEYLTGRGVELVAIDYLSVEQFELADHRTHLALLEREVVVVEGVDLTGVPAGEYELVCLPLKLAGLDGAPARVVLIG